MELPVFTSEEYLDMAKEIAELVISTYYDETSHIAFNNYNDTAKEVTTLWPYTEIIAMRNRIYSLEKTPSNLLKLKESILGLNHYKVSTSNTEISKYASGWGSSEGVGTVFYDDNCWVARELIAAYENTNDEEYLKEAFRIVDFILKEGYEPELQGIYWDQTSQNNYSGELSEGMGATINVCTTAPTVYLMAKLHPYITDLEKQKNYLDTARKMFAATFNNFSDKTTGCYNDRGSVIINDVTKKKEYKSFDNAKIPYNTGAMILAGVELYKITKQENFLKESVKSAYGADMVHGKMDNVKKIKGFSYNSWFNVILLDSYIELFEYDSEKAGIYIKNMADSINYSYLNYKNGYGFISPSWVLGWDDPAFKTTNGIHESGDLLLHAANSEVLALLSAFYSKE